MNFELDLDHRMIRDLVARFVNDELIPLEAAVLAREAESGRFALHDDERTRLDERSKQLGLWGLDAPLDLGGADLPALAMTGVNEAMGATITPYTLPPDSPNLRMLRDTADDAQRDRYLAPYARGITRAAMAISEPGAGSDPGAMATTAARDGDAWVLNGRKIWISHATDADWTIVMALTDRSKGKRGGISAFIVERDTPGFVVERRIPMIGGLSTYEIVLQDCRIPAAQLLGREGDGFAPMQARLANRRLQMAAWCIGRAGRAVALLCDYAKQRKTFGVPLAERQAVQWWVADALTQIHACRLMTLEAAARVDAGQDARTQISMVKVFATEMASSVIDHAMQTLGAMGMTKELPLQQMASEARLMRIFEGPSEVHRWVVARSVL
ncbi:acyl-CoA dehydrogenase family protein [Burkholderia pseudomultivorans]|uniref:acyl-CoA dehydrogenase family protein n=1 Tax=Burkholderia pseudomultivorans TaxID=1207504 RepID=UPI0007520391|nr:acyl-CoA dehydrogenase [Burkholderia pseudomultivorans]KWI60657.1 acyl-CoA dehydrogenase [Burkholderia pseudomultivorans]MBF5008179.1 acyl-CoA dehydrogenase [Burkholderia pseudomultivorans]